MQERVERRPNDQRSAEMRARLVAAGRELFAGKGFAATGTPEIVARAKVTRGALYHHFADKTDLFRAVATAEAEAVAREIEAAGEGGGLTEGTRAYFRAMRVPGRARVLLIDGPAVLGPAGMDRIDARSGRATLEAGLASTLPDLSLPLIAALATVLSAAFDRAALAIAEGADEAVHIDALMRLVGGLSRR
ncbi:MAG: TetR/AcrR family transcriptional regulator [Rhodobacteraceae bacterium]|jgi:AcrR family transcriptional regulator|nr:TetR/AcrR family transcriptional regulator [Paracoccaceae bacterium]